jgi:hypothetical protein
MTPAARHTCKGVPVDPFSAAQLADSVISILSKLATPVVRLIKGRLVRRKVRKIIERASSDFVAGHPETATAMAGSADAIAYELAQLRGGRPLGATRIAEHWAAAGYFGLEEATAYTEQFARELHDELLGIDGFRDMFQAGATITIAETIELIEAANERDRANARADDERDVAILYVEAASEYYKAALALLGKEKLKAMALECDAETRVAKARLQRDSLTLVKSKDLRERFAELVEDRYDDVEAACEAGSQAEAEAAVDALDQGRRDFSDFVTNYVRAI